MNNKKFKISEKVKKSRLKIQDNKDYKNIEASINSGKHRFKDGTIDSIEKKKK